MYSSNLDRLNSHLSGSAIDAFICSASFEERSTVVAERLNLQAANQTWIAVNREFEGISRDHLNRIVAQVPGQPRVMKLDWSNPIATADAIAISFMELCTGEPKRVLIDITTFTRESLLILVKFLSTQLRRDDRVEFVYTNAGDYSIGDSSEDKWLSKGIHEVRSVIGYPGDLIPSRKNHLIVLMGFEDERALALIQDSEPARISLGLGDETEQATGPHQETNVSRLRRVCSVLGSVNRFIFKGYDAESTRRTIREVMAQADGFNTILAPMHTKISTLGAAAVALENESVQVCYAQPNRYNVERYSKPGSHFFHFSLEGIPK